MADGGSLININLSDLSKPATVLVEKVCNAVGMLYEPKHIKRVAKAEAAADEIRALGRIRTSALERRAMKRLVHQEARKQENIEQITSQAAKSLPQDAKVQDLDEDWVAHFFKQCDTVSDKEM
jgi:cell division protein FtsX